jgi:hypothetical protein
VEQFPLFPGDVNDYESALANNGWSTTKISTRPGDSSNGEANGKGYQLHLIPHNHRMKFWREWAGGKMSSLSWRRSTHIFRSPKKWAPRPARFAPSNMQPFYSVSFIHFRWQSNTHSSKHWQTRYRKHFCRLSLRSPHQGIFEWGSCHRKSERRAEIGEDTVDGDSNEAERLPNLRLGAYSMQFSNMYFIVRRIRTRGPVKLATDWLQQNLSSLLGQGLSRC